jgi:hypothetical protein
MGSHPDLDLLIRYAADELPEPQRGRIATHLERCPECRRQSDPLEQALQPQPGALAPGQDVAGVLGRIGEWLHQRRREGPPRRLIAAELAPYLGDRCAGDLMLRVSPSGENLLSTVEPVLALFLGGRAAGKLVSHVVDRAIAEE